MTFENTLNLVTAVGAILVPIAVLVIGQLFRSSQERSNRARREVDQLANFIGHLSSDNSTRRKLAYVALKHIREQDQFPAALLDVITNISMSADPEDAAFARIIMDDRISLSRLDPDERALLTDLLAPLNYHFGRTRELFDQWVKDPGKEPNEPLEDSVRASNIAVRSLLTKQSMTIPGQLQDHALALVKHYDAWLSEYLRVRPDGVRQREPRYVFVGPKGFPFPAESEKAFAHLHNRLMEKASVPA